MAELSVTGRGRIVLPLRDGCLLQRAFVFSDRSRRFRIQRKIGLEIIYFTKGSKTARTRTQEKKLRPGPQKHKRAKCRIHDKFV